MSPRTTPTDIAYDTPHCTVRELVSADACQQICNWMSDPAIARALNAPVRALTIDDLRKYIADHDRIAGHLLGIFRKSDRELIGLWSVYVDWQQSEFLVNVLIPGSIEGDLGAMKETGRPLYAIMFDDLGLDVMRYNVLSTNQFILGRPGNSVAPEHTSSVASAVGQGHETVNHYRVTRADRERIRAERADRDKAWIAARNARRTGDA